MCGGAYKVVVVVRLCVCATRGVEQVWARKSETELPWLGFGLQWGCKRWRGVLWGYSPHSHAKLERGDWGLRWYCGWWWLCLPADLVLLLLLLFFSTHSPPLCTHS